MGGDTSRPLPPLPSADYMAISSFSSDSMLLYYVTQKEVEAVRNAVCASWRKGIGSEEFLCEEDKKNPQHRNCLRMKLNGRPWGLRINDTVGSDNENEAFNMRTMMRAVLDALHAIGWKIMINSDMYESIDLCFWMFHREEENTQPLFSVALASKGKIQVSNAPADATAQIKKICEGEWSKGVDSVEENAGACTIRLKGTPWQASDESEAVNAQVLVAEIIKKMAALQCSLYTNANVRGHGHVSTDTLYFKHDPTMVQADLATMHISSPDLITLVKLPDSVCAAAKEVITEWWPNGIQSLDTAGHQIKLKGRPFDRSIDRSHQDSVYARRLVTKLFEKFAACGYMVQNGLNLSRSVKQKTTFLFRKGDAVTLPFMCVSINWEDTMQLVCAPEDICERMADVVAVWEKGENESDKLTPYDGCQWQTKLKGYPWVMFDKMKISDGVYGQALLLYLLVVVQEAGWKMVCSGDLLYKYESQKHKGDYPTDNHAWWFIKN